MRKIPFQGVILTCVLGSLLSFSSFAETDNKPTTSSAKQETSKKPTLSNLDKVKKKLRCNDCKLTKANLENA